MASNIVGIDHAIIGVRNLERAKEAYEKLGFRTTPRGRHVGWGTANYCLMFEEDYLEILGIVDADAFTNNLDSFLETREGLLSIVLRSTDAAATRQAWADAGLDPAEVKDLSRQLEPDVELRFQNVTLDSKVTADVPIFACSHLTADQMRQPGWIEHPNGAVGIRTLTAVTNDPAAVMEPMSRIFGGAKITETDSTVAVHTGRGVLLFATPDDLDMLHPELEMELDTDQAALAVLSVRVRDLGATAGWLDQAAIPFKREASGVIGVGAEHACGVMLEFTL
ncbi:MAG: VOC family protein, partial [Alphaproteobacteria bacterium]|nr:VOC family protein [Alphaproteobacteria bacterium]